MGKRSAAARAGIGHRRPTPLGETILEVRVGRSEVGAIDTWNAVSNHHMIAINERLGATVVAVHQSYRGDLAE